MRRIIISLILLVGFCSGTYPIYFKHIGMQEGLSQLSVMAIYQDNLGRMWFGTEEGISIYDGVQTKAYKPSEFHRQNANPIGNQTHFIAGDKDGNVFFDSDQSLIRYDIQTQKFSCLRKSNVYTVASIKGTIWVGIADSILTWNPDKNDFDFVTRLENRNQRATCLLEDSGGRYWIGTTDGLFRMNDDKSLTCMIMGEDIYDLYEDSKYNLWISIRMNGMYKRDVHGNFTRYRYDPSNPNNISSNQVRDFVEDNFGNIWFGTFTGLNKYNPISNQFEVYARNPLPGSMTHSSVFPVYKDRQGTIWLGTYYGGVNYFNPETDIFTVYAANNSRNDCLNYPFVGNMVEDKDNNIWICTEGGGLNFFDRKTKKFTYFMADENRNSIAHNNLKAIAYSPERNKLYIGTHTGGLSIYDIKNKRFKNPYFEDPSYAVIAGDRINQMRIYNDELICTGPKGIFKMNLYTEKVSPLFKSGKYYGNTCFLIDSKGYIWLAYGKGVWKINLKNEEDKVQYRSGENGLGTFPISQIIEDKEGRIFLGTRGSGLFHYDEKNKRFIGYTTENSFIASDYCYELTLSTLDQLVITGDKGITFFDPDQNLFKVVELGTALPLTGINIGCGILDDMIDLSLNVIDAAIGDATASGSSTEWAMRSFFGRINLDWENKYLLEVNLRADQSSRFLSNNRTGYFPSASVAWRMDQEAFMEDWVEKGLSNLKFRLSYGSLGNNSVGNYDAIATYANKPSSGSAFNYTLNNALILGLAQARLANPALTWESTYMTNVGFDFGLVNNKLTGTVDYFNKRTKDILINLPAPDVHGTASIPKQNSATVTNQGIEMTLGWQDQIGDFSYGVNGNFTFVKNKVNKFKGTDKGGISYDGANIIWEGHSINSQYLLRADRIIQTDADLALVQQMIDNAPIDEKTGKKVNPFAAFGTPQKGDLLYKDINGDGIIDMDDREIVSDGPNPKFQFGLNLNAAYKGFDFSVLFQGQAGVKVYWQNALANTSTVRFGYQLNKDVAEGRWVEGRTDAIYPRLLQSQNQINTQMSDFYLENKAFLKIRNIQLGYSLPKSITKKMQLERLRFYGSLENFFTFTSYRGFDPEISGLAYPAMKSAVLGVNVTF